MDLIKEAYNSNEDSNSPESKKEHRNLLNYFDSLLDSKKFSDFKIICYADHTAKEIYVHSIILSRVQYFKNLFVNKYFEENDKNQMTINDFSYTVVKEMCRFIYTTSVQQLPTLASELLMAANKYGIDGLKNKAENHLITTICIHNAGSLLILGHTHMASRLDSAASKFIDEKFDAERVPLTGTVSTRLIRALNIENAADVLIFAYIHKCDELKRAAMKYINKRFARVKVTIGWKEQFPKFLIDRIEIENAADLLKFGVTNEIDTLKEEAIHFIRQNDVAVKDTIGYKRLTKDDLDCFVSPEKRQKLMD